MNLALEKGEKVTTGGKGRGEIGGEAGEVIADAPTMDGLGKRYGMFSVLCTKICYSLLFLCSESGIGEGGKGSHGWQRQR